MKNTLKVQGMSCSGCVNSVEGSVGKLMGVSSVDVNLASGEVSVVFDEQEITLEQIKKTIEEQGYDID